MILFCRVLTTSSMKRFGPFLGFLVISALSMPALSSQVSERFHAELESSCLKIDSPEVCACYAKSVTDRYDDGQLVAIYNLLSNKEAKQMFLVAHSVEGRACKAPD